MRQLILLGIFALMLVAACTSSTETGSEDTTAEEQILVVEPTIADIEADLDTSDLDELEGDLDLLILE